MRVHLSRKERSEMERFMENLGVYNDDEQEELRMAA